MKDTIYVITTKTGVSRMLKTRSFDLHPGERAIQINIEIPDEAYAPPLLPTVRLAVPAEALTTHVEAMVESPSATGKRGA